jgi:hypothetical protein
LENNSTIFSEQSRSSRRATRQSNDGNGDSDDNDTVDEDTYKVDFTQNFWESPRIQQEIVAETVQQGDNIDVEMPPQVVEVSLGGSCGDAEGVYNIQFRFHITRGGIKNGFQTKDLQW